MRRACLPRERLGYQVGPFRSLVFAVRGTGNRSRSYPIFEQAFGKPVFSATALLAFENTKTPGKKPSGFAAGES